MPIATDIAYRILLQAKTDPSVNSAFGQVSREITETKGEVERLRGEQSRLNREIRQARRAGRAYDHLQQQLDDTKRSLDRATVSLARHTDEWNDLRRAQQQWGSRAQWAAGIMAAVAGATVLATDVVGRYAAELRVASRESGIAASQIDRYIKTASREFGVDLGVDEFKELGLRIDEARQGAGEAKEALDRLGIDPNAVGIKDLDYIIARLGDVEDSGARINLAEQLGGEQFGRFLAAFSTASDEVLERHRMQLSLTERQISTFQEARAELGLLKQGFEATGVSIVEAMLPALRQMNETLLPIVAGLAEFVANNPGVVAAIAAIAAGLTAGLAAIWAYNTALAVRAALEGPIGWVKLGVAAAVGVGTAAAAWGVTAGLANAGDPDSEEERDRRRQELQDRLDSARETADAAREGTMAGAKDALAPAAEKLEDVSRQNRDSLQPILDTIECARRAMEAPDAPMDPDAPPDPPDPPGPTPLDLAVAKVANLEELIRRNDARDALGGTYGIAGDSIASIAPLRLRTGEVRQGIVQPAQQRPVGHAGRQDRARAQERPVSQPEPEQERVTTRSGHAGRQAARRQSEAETMPPPVVNMAAPDPVSAPAPVVNVAASEPATMPPPIVTVASPDVHVAAPEPDRVSMPERSAPSPPPAAQVGQAPTDVTNNIDVTNNFYGHERPERTIAEVTEREIQLVMAHRGY